MQPEQLEIKRQHSANNDDTTNVETINSHTEMVSETLTHRLNESNSITNETSNISITPPTEPPISLLNNNNNNNNNNGDMWHNMKSIFFKYLRFIGPGIMVSVAYIDPGNYATSVSSGAAHEFSLLCIVLLSNFIAIFLQCLCIKLGSVTGKDLSRCCKTYLPPWMNWIIYFFAEAAIIATDIAEVIGTAIALNILIKVPLPAGVAITCIDVLTVMIGYRPGSSSIKMIKIFECAVAILVFGVFICFAVELAYIPKSTSVRHVFRGFVPSKQMFQNNGMYDAISILGATVMPHSLFLGSALVQPRLLEYDIDHNNYSVLKEDEQDLKNKEVVMEERYYNYRPTIDSISYCMKYSMIELALTLFTVALFINCAILIISGATLFNTPDAAEADLYGIYNLLSHNLAPAAGTIFMLALLLSGQSAGIVCTMAGQIVCEGHINWKLLPWQRRLVSRCISIVPCLVISICLGKTALNKALNASQVVLSIVLPFLVAPLIYFTCSKKIMSTEVTKKVNDTQIETDAIQGGSNDQDEKIEINISKDLESIKSITENTQNGNENVEVVNMANNWITSIVAVIIWIFLSLLNCYAIVELGINHGTDI